MQTGASCAPRAGRGQATSPSPADPGDGFLDPRRRRRRGRRNRHRPAQRRRPRAADEAATIADARRVGAEALQERAYDRALLLAVEGVHLSDSADARTTCSTPSSATPGDRGDPERRPRLLDVESSPDGRHVIVSDSRDAVTAFDRHAAGRSGGQLGAAGITYGAFAVRPGWRCRRRVVIPDTVRRDRRLRRCHGRGVRRS